MRILLVLFLSLFVLASDAQSKVLLIGRNLGTKTLPDSNTIRTFGFAKGLNDNPSVPGPTLHVREGDSLTIDFWNISQGAGHTIHLHGLDVDQANDGVPHLSYTVEHMEHGYYKFKAPHPGTYLYHCHVISSIHVQAGMYGMLIVHTKSDSLKTWEGGYRFDKEFALLTSEIDTFWHQDTVLNQGHDHMIHTAVIPKFNPQFFLVNGHASRNEREVDSIHFKAGEKVFLRLANIGNLANKYHFPSFLNAQIVSSDGRALPSAEMTNELWVFPGERYGVLLDATLQGKDSIQLGFHNMNTLKEEGRASLLTHVQGSLGIRTAEDVGIAVFPNPGNGHIFYSIPASLSIQGVQVYSNKGELVFETNAITGSLNLGLFPKGLYHIQFIDEDGHSYSMTYLKIDQQ